jgi:alpha-tubulin suppressor-like RCC1 family protein
MRIEIRTKLVMTSALAAFACGGGGEPGVQQPEAVASVSVTPPTGTIMPTTQLQLTATARDASHRILPGRALTWRSADSTVATVSAEGLVTGIAPGFTQIVATSENKEGAATIAVIEVPVASVTVTPIVDTVLLGRTRQLVATATDSVGHVLTGRPVQWESGSSSVVTVSAGGLALATGTGAVRITATVSGVAGSNSLSVPAVFAAAGPGPRHTCALRADGVALCWGENSTGQLGRGATGGGGYVPAVVQTPLTFMQIAGGADLAHYAGFTCGLATDGHVYCWGANGEGRLGAGDAGSATWHIRPVVAATTFIAIALGGGHACAIATGGQAYCWGDNSMGQLGTGDSAERWVPTPVASGRSFTAIGAGLFHTCALESGGAAYCWGANESGELGNGVTDGSPVPVAVSGGLLFNTLSVGLSEFQGDHNCALTAAGSAYCWGSNYWGQIGDGTKVDRTAPTAVTGGLTWTAIAAGGIHTCGIATGGALYCWGLNAYGELALGTVDTDNHFTPVAVPGVGTFQYVASGSKHSCAIAAGPARTLYCWGDDEFGKLGAYVVGRSATPLLVMGF